VLCGSYVSHSSLLNHNNLQAVFVQQCQLSKEEAWAVQGGGGRGARRCAGGRRGAARAGLHQLLWPAALRQRQLGHAQARALHWAPPLALDVLLSRGNGPGTACLALTRACSRLDSL